MESEANNEKNINNTQEAAGQVKKRKKKHKIKPKKRIVFPVIGFVLMIIAGVYFSIHAHYFQTTDDAFVEGRIVSVSPRVFGPVVKLYIDDNQRVKKGDLLLEIDPEDYKVLLKQKQAELLSARASLNVANKNIVESEAGFKKTEEDLSAVKSRLDYSKKTYDRDLVLKKDGIVSEQEFDKSRMEFNSSVANYNSELQKRRAADIQVQSSKARKDAAIAEIKRLESEIEEAKLNLSYTKIYAPSDGKISSRTVEEGNYVQKGQPLFSIVSDEVWVVANYKETQLTNMKEGQEVLIKIDTYPDKKFRGKVDSIQRTTGAKASLFPPENAVGSYVKIVQRIPVKIKFTEEYKDFNIVPGMSCVPKVRVK